MDVLSSAGTRMSVIATVPVAIVVILLLRWVREKRRNPMNLPPGPWGVPLLGSLPFADANLHRYLAGLAEKYGPIVSLRFGSKLHVAVSSPALAMEMFKTQDMVFANHAVPSLTNRITGAPNILFAPYGTYWRVSRKVAVHEVLSNTVINSLEHLRKREIDRGLASIRSQVGTAVDVRMSVFSILISVLLGMVWEDALKEEKGSGLGTELLDIFDGISAIVGFFNLADYFPVLAPFDLQGLNRKMAVLSKRLDHVLDSIINQRRADVARSGRSADATDGPRDFLQIMLDIVDKNDPEMPIDLVRMKTTMMEMLFSGSDTTSTTTEWTMTELMRHPEVMRKVHEELDAVVGRGCPVEESHLPRLEYLMAVLKENMRLHATVPLLVPRYPSETTTLAGYTIPKGTSVFVNIWAIQRDPTIWKDPLVFRPERFLEEPDRWDFQGKSFEFMPFGGGRRTCPGPYLAERMMMYTLASLLHTFRWELPEGTTSLSVEDTFGIALKKKDALVLVPYIR